MTPFVDPILAVFLISVPLLLRRSWMRWKDRRETSAAVASCQLIRDESWRRDRV